MGRLGTMFALSQADLGVPVMTPAEEAVWPLAQKYGDAYGIDPALIMAVTWQESRFDPRAYRGEPQIGDASRGLMQVLWKTAQPIAASLGIPLASPASLFDPETNVAIGSRYLADQIARYNHNLEQAVAAYNAGSAQTTRTGAFVNQPYVDAVMGRLPVYQQQQALPLLYPSDATGVADTGTAPGAAAAAATDVGFTFGATAPAPTQDNTAVYATAIGVVLLGLAAVWWLRG